MNDQDTNTDFLVVEDGKGEEKDDEVQVLEEAPPIIARSDSEGRREQRRRRRRRLRRIVQRANGFPSFVGLLQANLDVSEDEEEADRPPKRIRIDVDAELGLKDTPSPVKSENEPSPRDIPRQTAMTPEEEGYYEGVISPMFLAEDVQYLSGLQQWVRRNLEFFSATDQDAAISQAGRRTPTVRGKVGIRCIHCAKAASSLLKGPEGVPSSSHPIVSANKIWPAGAISYPFNIAGIYSICSQKPQLHFEHCPNLPVDAKAQFLRLSQDASANVKRSRRSQGGIPSSLYYSISAKRVGLIDIKDGIRFGRDLSLEPLPFETVRMQTEDEINSSSRGDSMAGAKTSEPRITADEESERVLAEAVTEKDEPSRLLARSEDKAKVSDYIFLTIRQMAICHAVPSDFSTRGKKTKLMRVGFAGFCCRHCMEADGAPPFIGDFSCRSFSSAADNLSSAISNSFTNHLQKCYKVPSHIKKALSAYKKIHQRQIVNLPYGSQRRLFHELWSRLRNCDKSEVEMQDLIKRIPDAEPPFLSSQKTVETGPKDGTPRPESTPNTPEAQENTSGVRPESFPVCEDAETQAIVRAAEENWDPNSNDKLVLPSDRQLISDFVFLTMRQLRVATPDAMAAQRGRRGNSATLPGISCIHCHNKNVLVSPSGRSFPSAPDNFASALNSSLFTHMQNCPYVPADLKRALNETRKIHSKQCSSLKFGSQRRFFNLLFDRLRHFRSEYQDQKNGQRASSMLATNGLQESFEDFGFINIPAIQGSFQTAICRHCRMVPFQFRARGSVVYDEAAIGMAKDHSLICKKDCFDFELLSCMLEKALQSIGRTHEEISGHDSFKALIKEAVNGNEELASLFSEDILRYLLLQKDKQETSKIVGDISHRSKGLWTTLPESVDRTRVASTFAAFAADIGGVSSDLRNYPAFADFLFMISPTLQLNENVSDSTVMRQSSSDG